jgi:hypothetical protein
MMTLDLVGLSQLHRSYLAHGMSNALRRTTRLERWLHERRRWLLVVREKLEGFQ